MTFMEPLIYSECGMSARCMNEKLNRVNSLEKLKS